jgi:flagellar hook protein FlgE
MYSGVSGLKNHQIRMDIIGNNIANVNTIGFKAGRVTFQEIFNQTVKGASAAQGDRGGTNPHQVGLGMAISSIDTNHAQGNLQTTGKTTDLAIQGNGFFVLGEGNNRYYTRAGNFDIDTQGNFISLSNGLKVMGWNAVDGLIKTDGIPRPINIPVAETLSAEATTKVNFGYNLSTSDTEYTTTYDVYDSKGNSHRFIINFAQTDVNEWSITITGPNGVDVDGDFTLNFDNSGKLPPETVAIFTTNGLTDAFGVNELSIELDFSKITNIYGNSSVAPVSSNGYPPGNLESIIIDPKGVITGTYSNGLSRNLAQVALAKFANPSGLNKLGENLYQVSNNSGLADTGSPATKGLGSISPGSLEMSNVDLSFEFTEMIVTQRGFQANSRIITASDEMLNELVNLKR